MSKRRRRKRLPEEPVEAKIESLSHEGRGIAHIDGKVVFVDFALPGETVEFKYTRTSKNFDEGRAVRVIEASPERAEPICEHFGVCGGCNMQHQDHEAQIRSKQDSLMQQFEHLGHTKPAHILPPLRGPVTHYRQKARLGVKYVQKKGKVLVGFREKGNSFLADLHRCPILHASVGERLTELSELIMSMQARETIPQIEVAVSDTQTALVFRHLAELSDEDQQKLVEFARQYELQIMLQPGGPQTVTPLWPEHPQPLSYRLEEQDITIEFQPNDFTQVNSEINQTMVSRALQLLDLADDDEVLDLFCGLGNFTLAMARECSQVVGVEGSQAMVLKARDNAVKNNIDNTQFFAADLSTDISDEPWLNRQYDKILLDPPRSGAMEMLRHIGKLGASRIVYVSCNPATLARDTDALVNQYGYTLLDAGVMDMFPHTAHVESIALFVKS